MLLYLQLFSHNVARLDVLTSAGIAQHVARPSAWLPPPHELPQQQQLPAALQGVQTSAAGRPAGR